MKILIYQLLTTLSACSHPNSASYTLVSPDPSETILGTGWEVSDIQSNIIINDQTITGTLENVDAGVIIDRFGEGHYLYLIVNNIDSSISSITGDSAVYTEPLTEGQYAFMWKVDGISTISITADSNTTVYDISGLTLAE